MVARPCQRPHILAERLRNGGVGGGTERPCKISIPKVFRFKHASSRHQKPNLLSLMSLDDDLLVSVRGISEKIYDLESGPEADVRTPLLKGAASRFGNGRASSSVRCLLFASRVVRFTSFFRAARR